MLSSTKIARRRVIVTLGALSETVRQRHMEKP